ncbi:hypothetical protein [Streptacidiphilus melanogenes]|uniref:hypothetical protein n=1 Tax=Streptacidiphilus melanogenes TaxID=411235 RepID=UPI0005AA4DFD|nr:hypothetical protein [Streptacidiphilus melanogenes]
MTTQATRFTAVDETADLMERRGEPNLIYLELGVAGRLDPERLRAAVHTAFADHPATRSRRLPTPPWRTRSRWQVEPRPPIDPLTVLTGPDLDLDLDAQRRAILDHPLDLRQPPLLRLRLLSGPPGGDRLLLVAHHAGFDGMGFVGVLLAICAAYNAEAAHVAAAPAGAAPVGTPSVQPAHDEAAAVGAGSRERREDGAARADGRRGMLPPRPVRVAREPASAGRRGYGLVSLGFDVEGSDALARAARAAGVTLNDLLLAALGLAVTRWNTRHARPVEPLRITMPVNTRDRQARHVGGGNQSRLTSIDAAGRDARAVLAAVAVRTAEAKAAPAGPQGGPAAVVLGSPWLPRALRRALAPCVRFAARSFADTTMLSNLGPLADLPPVLVGAGEITELWAAAPAPMPRGLSVTALGAHGRLHVMFRHRFEALDAPAAAAFTDVFAEAVAELAAAAPAATAPVAAAPVAADTAGADLAATAAHRTEGNP